MSKVMRSVKNVTKGYSGVQVKVREATSNDPWGPTGTQMSEIAQLTYNSYYASTHDPQITLDSSDFYSNSSTEFYDIVDMLDKRLNDKGKNWRHVLKALKVLDYCLHEGSELVVTWARKNLFIIKTLREFVYVDEEGRDVGQNVRVAAKELTSLILDEERLRAERSDRKTWKSRVTGIEEFAPQGAVPPSGSRRPRPQHSDEDDAEYKLAIEASKHQEEEDRRRREGRSGVPDDDDDLAKALQLSREEDEERRKRAQQEADSQNTASLFDLDPTPSNMPQPTGMNMGYQQGSNVDWLGNPIGQGQNQMAQPQQTGYMNNNNYTGYPSNGYSNGFNNQPTGMYDPYGQQNNQQQQQQQQQPFQMQPTGFNNPYAQQQSFQPQSTASPEPFAQSGSNNPWASNTNRTQSPLQPMQTGSNNPFASGFGRPQTAKAPSMPTLASLQSLPEQKTLNAYTPPPQPTFSQPQQQKPAMSEHEQRLNALLSSGDGMDTFGNTGEMRIPAQHTAPGTFVNSAGAGAQRLTAEATGNNPFLRSQFTGFPQVSYNQHQMPAATGPAGMNGFGGSANPFAPRGPQQQQQQQQQSNNQGGDLIQF